MEYVSNENISVDIGTNIIEFIKNPLFSGICGFIGVVGVILAIFFYFKSKIIQKPYYTVETKKLIDLNVGLIPTSEIVMLHNGHKINKLYETTVKIWNAGKKPLRITDLHPQYIDVPFNTEENKEFYFLSIAYSTSRKEIVPKKLQMPNKFTFRFSFDFLDKGDYIQIKILHTCDTPPSDIEACIIGVPKGFTNVLEKQKKFIAEISNIILTNYGSLSLKIIEIIFNFFGVFTNKK